MFTADTSMLYISRVDKRQNITPYWIVRIAPTYAKGKTKIYTDSAHGGKVTALEKAKRYRDKAVRKFKLREPKTTLKSQAECRYWCETRYITTQVRPGGIYHYEIHAIAAYQYGKRNGKSVCLHRRQWSIPKWTKPIAIKKAKRWLKDLKIIK